MRNVRANVLILRSIKQGLRKRWQPPNYFTRIGRNCCQLRAKHQARHCRRCRVLMIPGVVTREVFGERGVGIPRFFSMLSSPVSNSHTLAITYYYKTICYYKIQRQRVPCWTMSADFIALASTILEIDILLLCQYDRNNILCKFLLSVIFIGYVLYHVSYHESSNS